MSPSPGLNYEKIAASFHHLFREAQLVRIEKKRLPAAVLESAARSKLVALEIYDYFLIAHADGGETYCILEKTSDIMPENIALLFDTVDDAVVGYGILRNLKIEATPSSRPSEEPHIGYTFTDADFRTQGLELRRQRMMNALSQALTGLPLRSNPAREKAEIARDSFPKDGGGMKKAIEKDGREIETA